MQAAHGSTPDSTGELSGWTAFSGVSCLVVVPCKGQYQIKNKMAKEVVQCLKYWIYKHKVMSSIHGIACVRVTLWFSLFQTLVKKKILTQIVLQ